VTRNRLVTVGALVILSSISSSAGVRAQVASPPRAGTPDPWLRLSTKPKDFVPAALPWRLFTIELPKGWNFSPGYRELLFSVSDKPEDNQSVASIVVEQMRLPVTLTASEINEGLAALEGSNARSRDPGGQGFEQQIKTISGRRLVFVTYTRAGFQGRDRVVIYAYPNGTVMYRLVCIAPEPLIASRYQAIFAHVAASFVPQPAGSN
jgi:hypothetical protein